MNQKLWYREPAREWMEGLPIGNGRLAAMIPGYIPIERITLNHEWLWRGVNRDRDNEPAAHKLDQVRQLLMSGQYERGTRLGNDAFGGLGGISGQPGRVDPYQPAGDFCFELDQQITRDYQRKLDLSEGLVIVSGCSEEIIISRQALVHLTENKILVRISCENDKISGHFWLERQHDPDCSIMLSADCKKIVLAAQFTGGIAYQVEARLESCDGQCQVEGQSRLRIENATEIVFSIDIGTNVHGQSPADECQKHMLSIKDWSVLLHSHIEAQKQLFSGIQLLIPDSDSELPTDQRIAAFRSGAEDPGMPLLYFNYGRYLLLAASICGELPANLQGKWNEELDPPWQSDYHLDINLQMSYWLAEPSGLQRCTEALLQYVERMVPHAKKAAADLYGCRGVWFPIQTDAWGRATPESYGWAVWTGAAAWLAQHFWWHYTYSLDHDFLARRAYPYFKEVAAFYETYLIEDDNQTLQFVPSQSPENRFEGTGAFPVSLGVSSAMDIQLATELLQHAITAAKILDVDQPLCRTWQDMLDRLPPLQVGSTGQLLEWDREFTEVEPGHRHISHLYGLYPGDLFTPEETPAFFEAARVSLEQRLSSGGGHTGWSRAWTACCYARLGKGDLAWQHLIALIGDFATVSLLDLHPPRIFQIDGNLGGSAAVIEMLLHSNHQGLDFLPALPGAWPEGEISGLRAQGGFSVAISWSAHQLTKVSVYSAAGGICRFKARYADYIVRDGRDRTVELSKENGWFSCPVTADGTVTVFPVTHA